MLFKLFCKNNQQTLHVHCFHKKAPPQTSDRFQYADLSGGAVNVGVWVDYRCMEFVVTGWCTKKTFYFWWCWLLRLNPRAWGEHITSQLSWAAAWLLVTCDSLVYLVVDELRHCVLWLLMIGLMVVLLMFFWHGEHGFTYRELMLF